VTTRRNLLQAGLVASGFGIALGGCSGERNATPVQLSLWANLPAEQAALKDAIGAFGQETGITVRPQVITDKYMDVMRSRFAARKPPDVFYLDSHEAPAFIRAGVLEPWDEAAQQPEDFPAQFLDAFRGADGRLYGLPKDFSTLALYINTGLLTEAGFSVADVPQDFMALAAFAQSLQERLQTRGKGRVAMLVEKDLARHLSALERCGPPLIDAQDRAQLGLNACGLAYLDAFARGRRTGSIVNPREDLGSDSPGAAFGGGKVVLMMEGNWVSSALRRDYPEVRFVTREMPLVNGQRHTMAFVVGWAVSRQSRNKDAAFRFARFMNGPRLEAWSRASGTLPTRRSVMQRMQLDADPVLKAHVIGASYATVWSRGIGLSVVDVNFANQFVAALNGSVSIPEAMVRAQTAANREIARMR
jgi:multiple sugar transport system substrate-binding protein